MKEIRKKLPFSPNIEISNTDKIKKNGKIVSYSKRNDGYVFMRV